DVDVATVATSDDPDAPTWSVQLAGLEPLAGPVSGERLSLDAGAATHVYLLLDGDASGKDEVTIQSSSSLLSVEDAIEEGEAAELGGGTTGETGAPEVALLTGAAGDGPLTLLAAAAEADEEGTFTVYRLPQRPVAALRQGAPPRPPAGDAPDVAASAVADLSW